ncbi:hypothetical protein, partial [Amycolatopsis lexingtonensis]|uniref:hypothetical protein n=1 Tax=Amycolatopsis lexingtonensis TaxID=218822 RepID=UPI003B84B12C
MARPGSVGEAMGGETHGNQPHTAAEPGRGEAPAAHRNPEPSGRHEPGDTAPWRDAKAELDPRTQQARLTGSLEPAREAHATTGVGGDHFLEQERWAGAASPEPKTPTQKVAFAVLRGLGVLHTGIDMVAGHDLLPTSKLTPLHPPKNHKPKGHEEKPAEPAPESTSDPKPGDPAVPPKPGEGAVAHVDPDTLKVDHVEPAERPHPEPTPAGAPAGRGHPSSDIDRAINPDTAHEHGPRPDDPPPAAAREHGPQPDDPPPPDGAHEHGPHPD